MNRELALGKQEKLKSRKQIEILFANRKSLLCFPLRISFLFEPLAEGEQSSLQIGVSASKRYFKRAVDRNRIKRLLREAYRLQKKDILSVLQIKRLKGYVFFIFVDKTLPDYSIIYGAMTQCLKLLQQKADRRNETAS